MIDSGADIAPQDRQLMAEALNQILAEITLLEIKTRLSLWCCDGPAATALGAPLGQRSQSICALASKLALRVRALGYSPPRDVAELLACARTCKTAAGARNAGQMLTDLAADHRAIAGTIRFARPTASDLDDGATLALFDQCLGDLEQGSLVLVEYCGRLNEHRRLLADSLEADLARPTNH